MNADQHIKRKWNAWMPLGIGFLALLVLVGVLGVWSVSTRIAGAVIASGMIKVESNRQVVQHPFGGVVGGILAKDGDTVEAGEVVLRLDDTMLRSELTIVEGQLYEILARKSRLEAERDELSALNIPRELVQAAKVKPEIQGLIDGQKRLFDARADSQRKEADQITEQVNQTHNQIAGAQAQLAAFQKQEELINSELKDSHTLLEKGLAQASRVSSLQREQARLLGEVGSLNATVSQLRGQIAALNIQMLKLTTTRREQAITTLRDLQYQELEFTEKRLSARETLSRMEVRSPVSGVVYGSQVFALLAVVSPAEPIMYIIPQDQPLVVASRVEAIHIDQVHVGQEATLRFTAFDQRQTPEIFGRVLRLSPDVFTDEVTGMSYYQAELLPNEGELVKLGGQQLLPGMPVEAYIRTSERSPLSYLAKPFMDYFNKAFRES
ncbi:HlyD family type I secretion periplasmic adaptor subunit [Falsihalocynthiibacter arcticus]|uniref:Membrane fusion protein (MFP) family protein n=1 Tax=Falsihalocynthiibacter arcticus TaxID=1579316 RepID=A0A126V649_9RHOB|nr:HlyD family type I secretion periplasmic adaptor subunit [Falsihalocynthiibacter arcticus]AML53804.1 RTX toxin [Falsihalocynthiibacter arcticus]